MRPCLPVRQEASPSACLGYGFSASELKEPATRQIWSTSCRASDDEEIVDGRSWIIRASLWIQCLIGCEERTMEERMILPGKDQPTAARAAESQNT